MSTSPKPPEETYPDISDAWRETLNLIPSYDPFKDAEAFYFDSNAAEFAIGFFAERLTHVKGELTGQPFLLEPWQQAIIGNLFGWKRKADNTRRYREAFLEVPRKNGKSLLASGICNLMFFCDAEPGAEIYCAAADREQAALVWNMAKRQIKQSPELDMACRLYQHSIVIEQSGSAFKAISAESNTAHGFNAHCIVIDELHAQRDRQLVDVLITSTGSRRQPLIVHITTSDYDRESICNDKEDYAIKVRDGVIQDGYFLPVIYAASKDDDWTSPEVWAKANPNLDISISREYLERECKRAQESPAYENTFKRLHLNIKTEQASRWIAMSAWDACPALAREENLLGRECFAGLDLASTTDISALVLVFPDTGGFSVLPYFWIPGESIEQRVIRDRVPYDVWTRDGIIRTTPGNVTDYDFLRRDINALGEKFKIMEIAADRWGAMHLVTQLQADGFPIVLFGQGFASMSTPSKELEKLILGKKLDHGGNPVLRWMASNVSIETDAADNIKPSKQHSSEKIDGIISLIMGLGRAILKTESPVSVYSKRGIISL